MLKINHILLENNKLEKDINCIFISDIHYTNNFDQNLEKEIIKKISEKNPQYMFITGDIVNNANILTNKFQREALLKFLKQLSYNIKTFVALGNHDITGISIDVWKELLCDTNIILLDNEIYEDDINIIGLTLPSQYYMHENSDILIEELKKYDIDDKYTILLIHSPWKILTKKSIKNIPNLEKIDLILSGHMHNGLMPKGLDKLPTSLGIISPQKTLFPIYTRGKIIKKINNHEITMLITGGVSKITESMPNIGFLKKMYNNDIEYLTLRGKNERK